MIEEGRGENMLGVEGIFQELVENFDDVVLIADRHFKIRYVSSSVRNVFHVEPYPLLGKSIFDFVSKETREHWTKIFQTNIKLFSEEICLEIQSHQLYFEVNVLNLRNDSCIVLKLHNITERKEKERQLILSNQQLDQVIFKTTHDLKAPLASVLGLITLAEKADTDEQPKFISLIKRSLVKLDSFIDEMNDFFRNEKLAIQRQKISLIDLIHNELETLKNLYQVSKILVDVHVEEGIELYSDNVRIKTIITNILSNAIKYSDLAKINSFIKISGFVDESHCHLKIEDNGIGIAAENRNKVFDLFFRGTDQGQGTGIGLFLVKDTIDRLKGSIEVKSEPGIGTSFYISIPNQIFQPAEVV